MDRCTPNPHRPPAAPRGLAVAFYAFAAVATAFVGCNDKPDDLPTTPPPKPATQPAPAPATAPVRPTTQQLLEAPRKAIVLGSFKLTLEVPPGWEVNSPGSSAFLEGSTPHGEVRIQLAAHGAPLKNNAITAMEKRARDEAAKQPTELEVVPLRNIGGTARKLERREFLRNLAITGDDGTVRHVDRVDWQIMAFVPEGEDFAVDVLNFTGLSIEQYQQDKQFLEHVLSTLHYDATGGLLGSENP
jgi:hypothetical protein